MPYKVSNIPGIGRLRLNVEANVSANNIFVVATLVNEIGQDAVTNASLKTLIFQVDNEIPEEKEIDENGRASHSFSAAPGPHIITVYIKNYPGSYVSVFRSIAVLGKKVEKPANIAVVGKNGRYTFSSTRIFYEGGGGWPASEYPVRFMYYTERKNKDGVDELNPKIIDMKTDNDGYLKYRFNFNGIRCNVFIAIGDHFKEFPNLYGPSGKPQIKDIPFPKTRDLINGRWIDIKNNIKNFRNGRKEAKHDLRLKKTGEELLRSFIEPENPNYYKGYKTAKFFWEWGYKLKANNNWWIALCWSSFFFSLIFNLFVFGLGYIPPEIELEKESEFFSFKRKEDIVVLPLSLRFWHSAFIIWLWGWMSYLSWTTTLLLFIASLVSFIFLFDEISNVWRNTEIMIRERRKLPIGGGEDIITVAPSSVGAPSAEAPRSFGRSPLTFKSYFILEFLMNLFFELGLMRR